MYKLMIVEDDIGIAKAIEMQAKMWNLQVHLVKNFKEVIIHYYTKVRRWNLLIVL